MMNDRPTTGIASDITCRVFSKGEWQEQSTSAPYEMTLSIYINGDELVSILCTPTKLNCLALGFLYSEDIIRNMSDVAGMRICEDEPIADIKLSKTDFTPPTRRTLTSGCGGGVKFDSQVSKVESDMVVSPEEILALLKQLYHQQSLYQQSGGIHCSALCDHKQLLVVTEDIGRHNTLDKIMGECLLRKLSSQDKILITTGRISSEMLLKSARMQVPIIVSRTSPTERAISLGRELGITVVGYARNSRLSVFTGVERLLVSERISK